MYEKLVDHKRYIGAHRKRFDETGHGNGIFGRKPLREFTPPKAPRENGKGGKGRKTR